MDIKIYICQEINKMILIVEDKVEYKGEIELENAKNTNIEFLEVLEKIGHNIDKIELEEKEFNQLYKVIEIGDKYAKE